MKRISVPAILVLIFCFQAFGQERIECPAIKVVPPAKFLLSDSAVLFSVSITGKLNNSKLEYKWTVAEREILDGQGTVAITIPTYERISGIVTATVEIKGLPEGYQSTFSNQIDIPPPPQCRCFDENEKIPWPDEKNRLQNGMMVELPADQTATGYIIFYIKNDSDLDSVMVRQKKILKFLESLNIPSSRIVMKIEKSGSYRTRIWILPKGAKLPG